MNFQDSKLSSDIKNAMKVLTCAITAAEEAGIHVVVTGGYDPVGCADLRRVKVQAVRRHVYTCQEVKT